MGDYLRAGQNPPVVFVSQMGTGGASWKPIIDRLLDITAFSYDRPGTGDAAPRPAPNPALPYSAFARELAELLEQHDLDRPAILVAHSIGSLIARVYAGLYPERVAGMVHADGSIPALFLLPSADIKVDGGHPQATEFDTVTGHVEVLAAQVPEVPTVILARTHGRWTPTAEPPHPAVEDLWRINQQILARQTGAPLIVCNDSSHQIPREAPDLVAYAAQAVIDAVRGRKPVQIDRDRLDRLGGHLDDQVTYLGRP